LPDFVPFHSSLTDQLATWYIKPRLGLPGVVRRIIFAVIVDATTSRSAIAQTYAANVYLGRVSGTNVRGVEAAGTAYFNRKPIDLSTSQCAALVAAIYSPSMFSPLARSDDARDRRLFVLARMHGAGIITKAEYETAVRVVGSTGSESPHANRKSACAPNQ
jgi:membrane peptidoglycan carboxypeptidase